LTGEGQGGGEKIDAEVMLPLPLIPSREGRGDKKVLPPGEGRQVRRSRRGRARVGVKRVDAEVSSPSP